MKKPPYLCAVIKQQSNENNKQRNNFRKYPRKRIYD